MSNSAVTRWKRRFDNFQKAFLLLREAIEERPIGEYSQLEQEGIVQRFEYTFEPAWKTVKDKLYYEGYDERTPRSVIRRAFAVGFISEEDTEIWIESLGARNLLSHTYDDEETAFKALKSIRERYYPVFERLFQSLEAEIERTSPPECRYPHPIAR